MLTDKLREGATGPVAKIIFSLIIISFAIAGVGSYLMPKVDLNPVKVNGQSISQSELDSELRREKSLLERQLGESFIEQSKDPTFNKGLRDQVLDKLVGERALAEHIYKSGVEISANLVKTEIKNMPEFQVDGRFNKELYLNYLRNRNWTPDMFGEYLRGDLAKRVYVDTYTRTEFALPSEIVDLTKMFIEQRTAKKLNVNLSELTKDIKVSDDEIKNYYEANKDKYLLPEEVKVSYIYLNAADLVKDVKYTDEDLQKFFNLHSELYTVPEKRKVAHILVSGDDAEQRINDINAKLKSGAKFEDLAKEFSEDEESGKNGGVLPVFSYGNMDASFEKAAYALAKVGDVTEPVSTQYGFHLIKLLEVYPEFHQEFKDAKESVIETYTKLQSKELFLDKKQIISDTSYENPDSLDATLVAAQKNSDGSVSEAIKIQNSDFVANGSDKAPFPLSDASVQKQMFNPELRETGINSEVIDLGETALVVVHVDDYKAPQPKTLADVTDIIKEQISKEKAQQSSEKVINDVLASIKDGNGFDSFVKQNLITVDPEFTYTRMSNTDDNSVVNNLFEMPKALDGKVSAQGFVSLTGDRYVLVLSKVVVPDEKNDERRDAFLNNQLVNLKAQEDYVLSIAAAKEMADIKYNTDKAYLKRQNQNDDEE